MSDQPNQPNATLGAGPDQTPGQTQKAQPGQPSLVVKAQYVKDLSFENPKAPHSFQTMQTQPAIQIGINVNARHIGAQDYEVTLVITGEAKAGADTIFVVELSYAGVFGLGSVPAEHTRPLLLIEGPRLLFPFARNIIAEATREGGYPPLLIQPVDFVELYRREIAQQASQQQA